MKEELIWNSQNLLHPAWREKQALEEQLAVLKSQPWSPEADAQEAELVADIGECKAISDDKFTYGVSLLRSIKARTRGTCTLLSVGRALPLFRLMCTGSKVP
jgi:hypothetical protein